MRLLSSISTALVLAILLAPSPANAQGRRSSVVNRPRPTRPERPQEAHPVDQFEKMTPEEREEALAKMSPEQRKKLQEKVAKYRQLSPERRAQLEAFEKLPPPRKEAIRGAYQQFKQFAPERQTAVRTEVRQIRSLPEPERSTRINSPEFRNRFNKQEQDVVRELVSVPE